MAKTKEERQRDVMKERLRICFDAGDWSGKQGHQMSRSDVHPVICIDNLATFVSTLTRKTADESRSDIRDMLWAYVLDNSVLNYEGEQR